jgi:hypothetical protein
VSSVATPVVAESLARALCEFAMLPVAEERFGVVALALSDALHGRGALARLDLTDIEPAAAFDARWE